MILPRLSSQVIAEFYNFVISFAKGLISLRLIFFAYSPLSGKADIQYADSNPRKCAHMSTNERKYERKSCCGEFGSPSRPTSHLSMIRNRIETESTLAHKYRCNDCYSSRSFLQPKALEITRKFENHEPVESTHACIRLFQYFIRRCYTSTYAYKSFHMPEFEGTIEVQQCKISSHIKFRIWMDFVIKKAGIMTDYNAQIGVRR